MRDKLLSGTALRVFNVAMLMIGIVALWWLLHTHGWAPFATLSSIGWGSVALLVTLDFVSMCCDAAALHTFMRPEAGMVRYGRVLGAQASSRAINTLTPGVPIGVATKFALLIENAPRSRVLSSIVLLNLSQLYVSVAVLVIGAPLTLLLLELPSSVRVIVVVALAVLVPIVVSLGVAVHRGALRTIVDVLRRLRVVSLERAQHWREKAREVDSHIRELHRNRSAGTWKGILWVIASKLVSWAAAIFALQIIGVPLTSTLIVGLLSLGILVTWLAALVPLGVGLADGGSYGLFLLLGATGPQGLIVAMVNRARSLIIAIIGLGFFGVLHAVDLMHRLARRRRRDVLRERYT